MVIPDAANATKAAAAAQRTVPVLTVVGMMAR
jgi:hypothetical protein